MTSCDESLDRLHCAGWSVGQAAFGKVWQVDGTNGENVPLAHGPRKREALENRVHRTGWHFESSMPGVMPSTYHSWREAISSLYFYLQPARRRECACVPYEPPPRCRQVFASVCGQESGSGISSQRR
jgi:hypothetical protein